MIERHESPLCQRLVALQREAQSDSSEYVQDQPLHICRETQSMSELQHQLNEMEYEVVLERAKAASYKCKGITNQFRMHSSFKLKIKVS